jgi:Ca2+-binding RTX toxin-like protein
MGIWTPGPFATDGDDLYTADEFGGYAAALGGNDTLLGGAGGDQLEGGDGNDTIDGGAGVNDYASYLFASSGVTLNLSLTGDQNTIGAGIDRLSNVENVWGSLHDDFITGNDAANTIEGFGGNDTLDGAGGIDLLSYFNAFGPITVSLAITGAQDTGNAGIDTISNFENIFGSAYNDSLTGDDLVNSLSGSFGDDTLNGALGTDVLSGGDGNDLLNGGGGLDTVDYYYAASGVTVNLSILVAQDTGGAGVDTLVSIEAILGSAHADTLTGDAANNTLEGAGGNDTISGAGGFDQASYFNAGAAVTVSLSTSSAQNTVGAGVDTLVSIESLYGSRFSDSLTGNVHANSLIGSDGNDTLNGAAAADTMEGGTGNDTYFVDVAADQTIEFAGQGTDLVITSVSRTLSAHIENLTLATTASIEGNGNTLANVITGNSGNNILRGFEGSDVLRGGGGQDTISGGTSSDRIDAGSDAVSDIVRFAAVAESTGSQRDIITNLDLNGEDRLDFTTIPTSIAFVSTGVLNLSTINAGLSAAVDAALAVNGAVLFDPSSGDLDTAEHSFLVVDANGDGLYRPSQDYVVELINFAGTLTLDDFI